eukprot:GSMAST32.ASY1.ANO1.697.1 assembled CDS
MQYWPIYAISQIFGIFIFFRGFFLTRLELPDISSSQSSLSCWTSGKPKYKRAIVLMIDALRYDFAKSKNYLSHMPFFRELLVESPHHALLAPFLADPPTVTMQRLKGMMTGGLPTFMDASNNFASPAINEDNTIFQLLKADKKIVFMGDDTWESLFPGLFHRSYPYPSFDVKDLHTVDDGVVEHLIPEMQKKDWDVIIGHFLGVDHVGHRYGPEHSAMAAKLEQMDDIIRSVVIEMEDDTLLVVMGDHGMTSDGNHGGATKEEVESTLFMYSKNDLHKLPSFISAGLSQVDLVPTLCLLLGVPIPFGNLGAVISPLFIDNDNDNEVNPQISAVRINSAQVQRYLMSYQSQFRAWKTDLRWQSLSTIRDESNDTKSKLSEIYDLKNNSIKLYYEFLSDALRMCREEWTQFDLKLMGLGLGIIFSFIIAGLVLYMNDKDNNYRAISDVGSSKPRYLKKYNNDYWRITINFIWNLGALRVITILVFLLVNYSVTSNSYVNASSSVMLYTFATLSILHTRSLLGAIGQSRVSNLSIKLPIGHEESLNIVLRTCVLLCSVRGMYAWLAIRRNVGGPLGCSEAPSYIGSLIPLLLIPFIFRLRLNTLVEQYTRTKNNNIQKSTTNCNILWGNSYAIVLIVSTLSNVSVYFYWYLSSLSHDAETNTTTLHHGKQNIGDAEHINDDIILITLPRFIFVACICVFLCTFITFPKIQYEEKKKCIGNFGLSQSIITEYLFLLRILPFLTLLALVQGPASPIVIVFAICAAGGMLSIIRDLSAVKNFTMHVIKKSKMQRNNNSTEIYLSNTYSVGCIICWWMSLIINFYYSTGHDYQFSSLQYNCGYIGLRNFNLYGSGGLVWLNTVGGHLIGIISLYINDDTVILWRDAYNLAVNYSLILCVLISGTFLAAAAFTAFIHRRHLMVWAIFAPKLVCETGLTITTNFIVLAIAVFRYFS